MTGTQGQAPLHTGTRHSRAPELVKFTVGDTVCLNTTAVAATYAAADCRAARLELARRFGNRSFEPNNKCGETCHPRSCDRHVFLTAASAAHDVYKCFCRSRAAPVLRIGGRVVHGSQQQWLGAWAFWFMLSLADRRHSGARINNGEFVVMAVRQLACSRCLPLSKLPGLRTRSSASCTGIL